MSMSHTDYLEDDFITEALRMMVKDIFLKKLQPDTGDMAQLIDKTAVQLTAYMRGRESRNV